MFKEVPYIFIPFSAICLLGPWRLLTFLFLVVCQVGVGKCQERKGMEKRDHGMQSPSIFYRPNSALSPAISAGELRIWSGRHPAALGRSDALPGHDRAGVPHTASV